MGTEIPANVMHAKTLVELFCSGAAAGGYTGTQVLRSHFCGPVTETLQQLVGSATAAMSNSNIEEFFAGQPVPAEPGAAQGGAQHPKNFTVCFGDEHHRVRVAAQPVTQAGDGNAGVEVIEPEVSFQVHLSRQLEDGQTVVLGSDA